MSAAASIEVIGVKDALRELGKIDKEARRQLTRDYKEIVAPAVNTAKNLTPTSPPLSGMQYNWKSKSGAQLMPWSDQQSDKAIKPFISGKKPKTFSGYTSHLATFGVRWSAANATIVEMSGRGSVPTEKGQQMVQALSARFGQPGRFLWRAFIQHEREVQQGVQNLVKDLMRQVNEKVR